MVFRQSLDMGSARDRSARMARLKARGEFPADAVLAVEMRGAQLVELADFGVDAIFTRSLPEGANEIGGPVSLVSSCADA